MGTKVLQNKINPNIVWTIVVLAIAIVALVSSILLNWVYCADKILKYLSFASTLLSILLSVFAILFSYISSSKLDGQIADINKAVELIKNSNDQLSLSNQLLVQTLFSMHEKLGQIEARQGDNRYDKDNAPSGSNYSNQKV